MTAYADSLRLFFNKQNIVEQVWARDCLSAMSPSALSSEPKGSRPNGFASLAMTYQMATYLVRVISVQKRFSIKGKTNTGSALRNPVTKGPESVIPAEAGIQAIELNDRTTGCPLSRA
jgi:hypothetical protein